MERGCEGEETQLQQEDQTGRGRDREQKREYREGQQKPRAIGRLVVQPNTVEVSCNTYVHEGDLSEITKQQRKQCSN